MAFTDALFGDADDDCPKKRLAYDIIDTIRQANNQEILAQIGGIVNTPCDPKCRYRRK